MFFFFFFCGTLSLVFYNQKCIPAHPPPFPPPFSASLSLSLSLQLVIRFVKATGTARTRVGAPPSLSPQHLPLVDRYLDPRLQHTGDGTAILNLDGLAREPSLAPLGIDPNGRSFASVLAHAARRFPDVTAVVLDNNGIATLVHIGAVFAHDWRGCTGVSLGGNAIADATEFRHLARGKNIKLRVLKGVFLFCFFFFCFFFFVYIS
jgi:hypothetical protein